MSVGCQETGYSVQLQNAAMQKVSKEAFNNYCHGIYKSRMAFTWDDMEQYLAENLGLGTALRVGLHGVDHHAAVQRRLAVGRGDTDGIKHITAIDLVRRP